MANKELQALISCTKEGIDHLTANDPNSIADELRGRSLIPDDVYSEVTREKTPNTTARKIYEAVTNRVRAQPSDFRIFLSVLSCRGLLLLVDLLESKLGK